MQPWRKILLNRYVWLVVVGAVWLAFFDSYNLVAQGRARKRLAQLYQDRAHYRQEIARLQAAADRLADSATELERVARETYRFKRPNEDVFVVVEH